MTAARITDSNGDGCGGGGGEPWLALHLTLAPAASRCPGSSCRSIRRLQVVSESGGGGDCGCEAANVNGFSPPPPPTTGSRVMFFATSDSRNREVLSYSFRL